MCGGGGVGVDGWMDGCTYGLADGRVYGRTDVRTYTLCCIPQVSGGAPRSV